MSIEKSAGAIIFYPAKTRGSARGASKNKKQIEYLLLHHEAGHWDFPKGNIEKGEKETDTVKREVKEETGLENIEIAEGFKEWIKYFYKSRGKTIFKVVTFYLAGTRKKKIKISWEHVGYKWLPYKEALEKLTFQNAKEILKRADIFLKASKIKN